MTEKLSKRLNRIEICGGIASGKTTLCTVLSGSLGKAEYENFHDNPFWSLFYKNPTLHAFETEITFFLQHYSQIKIASAERPLICDFSLLQDRAYAETNLSGGRLDAFNSVYAQALSELAPPSLIIHLVCSADEELLRIRRRARSEEGSVRIEYLDALNRSVASGVEEARKTTQVLTIDSEKNNFATDASIQNKVVADVNDMLGSKVA